MSYSALTKTVETVPAAPKPVSRWRQILRDLALIPVIVIVFIVGAVFVPNFATPNNIVSNILSVSAVLGVAVVAQSIVLIGGYFDLSAQSVIGLAPMLMVWLYTTDGGVGVVSNPWLAILSALVLGAIVGLVNGLLVGRLGMNAFIVTLAMLILLQGFTLGISGGQTFTDLPPAVAALGFANVLGIPVDVLILVLVVAIAAVFMRFAPTGRRIYAMGGNKEAARAAGINTLRMTIGLFIFSGVVAAFAGLMLSARIAAVTSSQGNNIIFTVFAAAVIGGISLDGGKGTIIGAATGVLLLGMIQNILVLSAVPSFWIDATYGAIILGALLIGSPQVRGMFSKLIPARMRR
ncbi:ABC transporter permease [Agromyces tropicus]|uniref:Autoinducer 2 import system permease protein LsrC n=1 Tax=Agromyces tropicus TaxID=555371 RepID=A0ABN2USK8_9MICO